ncbi:MAG: NnrS family protein [Mariprofundaceae bacterium]|nr:NnrS family protein [Mariprofundaceae bacterium]
MNIPIQTSESSVEKKGGFSLLALGFRPFFLAAGIFAVLLMATSVFGIQTGISYGNYFPLPLWHAHEMLFGYTVAVIAGFLLTAVRNWTGMETARGYALLALILLWFSGRVALAVPGVPEWFTVLIDMAFLPALALTVARPIIKSKQLRNLSVPLLLLLMAAGNGLIYAGVLGVSDALNGLWFSVGVILMLMALIAGRVMPFFTGRVASDSDIRTFPMVESLALPVIALWILVEQLFPDSPVSAVVAVSAAAVHAVRLYGWSCRGVWREPMLWVIHTAYGWLVAGFLLLALADFGIGSKLLALHGWTVGAIGMFTLGMMARVALGHTGRPMSAHPAVAGAFLLLAVTALIRVLIPILFPSFTEVALLIAAAGWILAFSTFVWIYTPYLVRPRVDGAPG